MEPENEIPQPTKTESDGTQKAVTAITTATISTPQLQRLAPVNVMEGLMAANPTRFGGIVPATLLLSHLATLTADRNESREDLREVRRENKDLHDQLKTAETRIAVLEGLAGSASNKTRVVGLFAFLAPSLGGIAIEIYKNQLYELAYITGGMSIVMLVAAASIMWRTGK